MNHTPDDDFLAEKMALKLIIGALIDLHSTNSRDRGKQIREMCDSALRSTDDLTWRTLSNQRAEMLSELTRKHVTAFFVSLENANRESKGRSVTSKLR